MLLWLGLPATLSNLSIACWPVLQMHLLMQSALGNPSDLFWQYLLQFTLAGSILLIAAQLLVASLILGCGPGPFWLRLAAYWGALGWLAGSLGGSFLLYPWLLRWLEQVQMRNGILVHDSFYKTEPGGLITVAATAPLILLAIQLPYWVLRASGGGRLVRLTADAPAAENSGSESLSIRNLLAATAIVAVSLGLLQLADRHSGHEVAGTHQFTVLLASGLAALGSLIGGTPFAVLFLRKVSINVAWAVTVGAALCCATAFSSLGLLFDDRIFWQAFVAALFCFLILFGSQGIALTVLRQAGWRLISRGSAEQRAG